MHGTIFAVVPNEGQTHDILYIVVQSGPVGLLHACPPVCHPLETGHVCVALLCNACHDVIPPHICTDESCDARNRSCSLQ